MKSHWIVPFLAGAALGVGVSFGLLAASGGASDVVPVGAPAAVSSTGRHDRTTATVAAAPRTRRASTPLGAHDVDRRSADEAVAGGGQIHGVVRDGSGKGVPGVTVRAVPRDILARQDDADALWGAAEDVDAAILQQTERLQRVAGSARLGVSTADGHYVIDGLGDAKYEVRASALGWVINAAHSADGSGRREVRPGTVLDFDARPDFTVDVTVTGAPAGEPVGFDAAPIHDERDRGPPSSYESETYARSPMRIHPKRPGHFRIRAVAGESREWASEWTDVTVTENEPAARVSLQVRESRGVRGAVAAPPGSSYGLVRIRLISTDLAADEAAVGGGLARRDVWLAPGARFAFLDVEEGRWILTATGPGRRELVHEAIDVGAGLVRHDIALPADDASGSVEVRVLGPDGAEVNDARFYAGIETAGTEEAPVTAVRNSAGTWTVPLWEPGMPHEACSTRGYIEEGKDDGTIGAVKRRWVAVESERLGRAEAECTLGDRSVVTLQFEAVATVEVELLGAPADTNFVVRANGQRAAARGTWGEAGGLHRVLFRD